MIEPRKPRAGAIRPDRNCALALASYSSSLWRLKTATDSSWRPKTVTSWCPVIISSTWPFTFPVAAHCRPNRGWARLPMAFAPHSVTGTVSSTTAVSSGEIVSIMTGTPSSISRLNTMRWNTCWTVWVRLSMSLVTVDSTSPLDRESK